MFIVAEEDSEESTGAIVILSSNWLTPKKCEAFWPTVKNQALFNKLLKNHENPSEDWNLIKIKRTFYESDDLLVARKKAHDAEVTSDLTDGEGVRKRKPSKRVVESDSSNDDEDVFNQHKKTKTLKKHIFENPGVSGNAKENESTGYQTATVSTQPVTSDSSQTALHGTSEINASSPIDAIVQHSATCSTTKSAYDYNVMQMLMAIKEQNTAILEWIRKQTAKEYQHKNTELQLPVEFPLNSYEDLQKIELFLASHQNFTNLCEYFCEFAGPTVTGTVNGILKHTLTNHLAATYSYRGKKGKRAFEDLTLKTAIVRATKKICNVVRDQPIENDIKVWLKHAPQRIKLQEKKIRSRLDRTA